MVTQAIDALGRAKRSRLRYANHKRTVCDAKVPATNTIIDFGIWVIMQAESYVVVGMVDTMAATVVKSSTRTAHEANAQLHACRPYSA